MRQAGWALTQPLGLGFPPLAVPLPCGGRSFSAPGGIRVAAAAPDLTSSSHSVQEKREVAFGDTREGVCVPLFPSASPRVVDADCRRVPVVS